MSDKQQSAVDFIFDELQRRKDIIDSEPNGFIKESMMSNLFIDIYDQAKELFKQQIIDAYNKNPQGFNHSGNKYFNDKFKTESNGK